jgi:cyclophilin family peptidyl-prolyl cis-trans isomerase
LPSTIKSGLRALIAMVRREPQKGATFALHRAPLSSGEGARPALSKVEGVRGARKRGRGLLLALPLALLIACGGDDDIDALPTETPVPEGTTVAEPAPSCIGASIASIQRDSALEYDAAPEMIIDPAKTYTATMQTSRGVVTIELAAADAPITVNNFVFLSCHGFYDGLTFHRVVKDPSPFVIQGGDPRGDGRGGPGYIFQDEFSDKLLHDGPGVLSMANSGANTNGSQFFITLAAASHLDGVHSVFGRVTDGMDAVNAIVEGDTILAVSITES